jgi:hypothetical protein
MRLCAIFPSACRDGTPIELNGFASPLQAQQTRMAEYLTLLAQLIEAKRGVALIEATVTQ